ncbi:RNA polymerase sigma factor [Streptoalloteichus hindustanus]|uniref:RNA polymerase sigma-70 factor, ECF subfamily n=1 Tax=Streptoalloteichus hindustanus TaxID=2017 RepID=A0A1M4UFY5_STRHI|nr:sigma-70 family RNA polymerase sigma factor [Streptoalloteichus hindustanus]SHE55577.1 RNA polymerase sigma-70 factor, ECF subfamily [Streptoalloteichus hindustanus]
MSDAGPPQSAVALVERLLVTHRAQMLAIARSMLGDAHDAEDAVQRASLLAWRKAAQLRDSGAAPAWLATITRRVCLQIGRERPDWDLWSDPPGGDLPTTWSLDPALQVAAADLLARLRAAFADLPEQARTIWRLKFVENLPNPEIAERTGLSRGAVGSQVYRARTALRRATTG